jgi:hypothetical protein
VKTTTPRLVKNIIAGYAIASKTFLEYGQPVQLVGIDNDDVATVLVEARVPRSHLRTTDDREVARRE